MFLRKNEFGGRFINIVLKKSAVAAGSVVERPPRLSNKRGEERRCLQNVCENHFCSWPRGRSGVAVPNQPFKAPEPLQSETCLEKKRLKFGSSQKLPKI